MKHGDALDPADRALEVVLGRQGTGARLQDLLPMADRPHAARDLKGVIRRLLGRRPRKPVIPLIRALGRIGRLTGLEALQRPVSRLRKIDRALPVLRLAARQLEGTATPGDWRHLLDRLAARPAQRQAALRIALEVATEPSELEDLLTGIAPFDDPIRATIARTARETDPEADPVRAAHLWEAVARSDPSMVLAVNHALRHWTTAGDLARAADLASLWRKADSPEGQLLPFARLFRTCGRPDRAAEAVREAVARARIAPPERDNWERDLNRELIRLGDFDAANGIATRPPEADDNGRVVIFDPGHHDGPGHHANYNLYFDALLTEETGERPTIVIGRDVGGESLAGCRIRRTTLFAPYVLDPQEIDRPAFDGMRRFLAAELHHIFDAAPPDIFVMHSLRGRMLPGLADWLDGLGARRPRLVILGLIEVDHLAAPDHAEITGDLLDSALSTLSDLAGPGLILFAETAQGVAWLNDKAPRLEADKFPYLAAERLADLAPPSRDRPTFGLLGATRPERGIELLLRVIEADTDACPWLLQVDRAALARWDPDAAARYDRIAAAGRGEVTFLDGFLKGSAFDTAFEQIDALILAYSGRYGVSGSGVLWEAIHARKALIVSEDTALAAELAAIGYPHRAVAADPAAIGAAVRDLSANWATMQAAITAFHAGDPDLPATRFRRLLRGRLAGLGPAAG